MNKIRLFKSSGFYKYYLKDFYGSNPLLASAPYKQQYDSIMSDCFAWADFWKKHLEAEGNYCVEEVIVNNEYIQKQWAREHNLNYDSGSWLDSILSFQIKLFKPDIWFCHSDISPETRLKIRRDNPEIKLVIGYDGTLKHDAGFFRGCDLMLSCIDDTISYYKEHGYRGYFLPYAFEENILNRITARNPLYNVSFVGSFYPFKGLHSQRLRLIKNISRQVDLDLWSPAILNKGFLPYIWAILRLIKNNQWSDIFNSRYLDSIRHGSAYGIKMYQILSDSKITLNFHGDIVVKKGGNMRLFEATGAGTCLLTDWKENLPDFFEPDKEIVTFKTEDECLSKIKYLLDHDKERESIALAGQKRTLEQYSYEKLLREFSAYLESIS